MRIGMRFPAALLVLILVLPSTAHAEQNSSARTRTADGLHTTTFETPDGTVTVRLPDDLAAGDTISGTVEARPGGETEARRKKNAGVLEGYVVELEGAAESVDPREDRPIRFAIPGAVAGGVIAVILKDRKGRPAAQAEVPVAAREPGDAPEAAPSTGVPSTGTPPAPPDRPRQADAPSDDPRLPSLGQAGRPVQVHGPFNGDFSDTRVRIGGTESRKLAESPRKVVVESPHDVVGATTIEVGEGDRMAAGEYRSVAISLTAPGTTIGRGERVPVTVTVDGLAGLAEPVHLRLENRTPDVVHKEGGDHELLAIDPVEVDAGGRFITSRVLTGNRPGAFVMAGSVVAPGLLPFAGIGDGINEWLCEDCAKECRDEAEACGDPGNIKFGAAQAVGRPFGTTTGKVWQKFRARISKCEKESCYWVTLYCCEYTHWVDGGWHYSWQVKDRGEGDDAYGEPAPVFGPNCGELFDALRLVGAVGAVNKEAALQWLLPRGKQVNRDQAAQIAESCGIKEVYDNAFSLSASDWAEFIQKFLGAFGGPKK